MYLLLVSDDEIQAVEGFHKKLAGANAINISGLLV